MNLYNGVGQEGATDKTVLKNLIYSNKKTSVLSTHNQWHITSCIDLIILKKNLFWAETTTFALGARPSWDMSRHLGTHEYGPRWEIKK